MLYIYCDDVMEKPQRLRNLALGLSACLRLGQRCLVLADCTVETHTECVADGQTALEFGVVYGYLHIHKQENMPRAAVCPCVSLGKWEKRPPRSAALGHCHCSPLQFCLTAMFKVEVPQDLSLRVRKAILHSLSTLSGTVGETDWR